jgi:hypothetical protein
VEDGGGRHAGAKGVGHGLHGDDGGVGAGIGDEGDDGVAAEGVLVDDVAELGGEAEEGRGLVLGVSGVELVVYMI